MSRILRFVFLSTLLVGAIFIIGHAQEATKTSPALTEVQKLQIQNVVQRVQLAQAQMQLAQLEYEKAQTEAQKLLSGLNVEGYDLDLQKLEYVKRVKK